MELHHQTTKFRENSCNSLTSPYENPRARFGFRGASIEHATKEEFEAFLKDGPQNLLPPYLADGMSHLDAPDLPNPIPDDMIRDPTRAWPFSASPFCYGVRRVRLDEGQRAEIRGYWPANHPRYWSVIGEQSQIYLKFHVVRDDQRHWALPLFHQPDTPEAQRTRDKVFPISIAEGLDRLKASTVVGTDVQRYDHDVLTGSGADWLGFEFCESRVEDKLIQAFSKSTKLYWRNLYKCHIDTLNIDVDGSSCDIGRWIAFENDEYAIIPRNIFQD